MILNAYYNGEFKNREDIRLPLSDRSIFFGDGIYDAAIGRNGKVFMLDEHINRFFANLTFLKIPFSYSKSQLKEIIRKTILLSGEKSYFIYFQLSRYSKERKHAYSDTDKSNLLITVSPFELSEDKKRLKLVLVEDNRHSLCNIKTINLLPSVMASKYAEDCDADEAVFFKGETVTECSHSNIHIIRNSVLYTHPLDNSILPGISRMHLLSVCKRIGVECREEKFSVKDMLAADEVLVTSSSKLAVDVCKIEQKVFPYKENSCGKSLIYEMKRDYLLRTC